ncbi:unnamed protein product [Rotaria sp. Silwood2]|nr:unnamed protein product [Rotaria sp. Silwood2]
MASWHRKKDSVPYETAELVISGIVHIVLIVIGTVGNIISIIVLLNKENRRTSTNIYLIFLCLVDTISLYQWNLSNIIYTFTDGQKQIWGQSLFICKLSQFFPFYTLHTSAMFLTFVELDRACLLRSRWYKIKIARPRVAFIICVIILLILFGLNGFLFALGFEYSTYDHSIGKIQTIVACYYSLSTELNNFFTVQYALIHLVIMYFLPFTIIVACTFLTIKKLIFKPISPNDQLAMSARRNRRISLMLLMMCLTYAVCTVPNRLCFSIFANQIIGHDYTDTVFLATNTLMYTRNAMNALFLYISVHRFKQYIRKIVLECLGKRPHPVEPRNNTMTRDYVAVIKTF